ncbi:unnamed protein product, partial [Candidula unifasciata]
DTLKEEDTSPSSSSQVSINTATATFAATTDEHIITSSTKSCGDRTPSSSPPLSTVKHKQIVDSPPDDVRAFFGHPLTRASNALNGDDADNNADSEALLHEYISLSTAESEELKTTEKLPAFLEIIKLVSLVHFSVNVVLP